jgi:hypothetical protein
VAEIEGNVEMVWMLWTFLTWACHKFKENGLYFITLRHGICLSELCDRELFI